MGFALGFAPLGAAVALVALAPSALLAARAPRDEPPAAAVPGVVVALERVGQAGVVALLVLAGDGLSPTPAAIPWLVGAAAALAAYLALWARYLRRRTWASLVAPWGPLPLPMAVLPVLAFAACAAAARSVPLAAAVAVLAVGHVGVSRATARALADARPST